MAEVIAAGHLCLDIIPALGPATGDLAAWLRPGRLVEVGPPVLAPGGAVANTGLALHQLGVSTALLGKAGDDPLGQALMHVLRRIAPGLVDGLMLSPGATTSYTVVLSPPGVDRVFLHCPGANDDFAAGEVTDACLAGARLLHFGYPPLMRRIYADQGRALAHLFRRARALGLATSLDMAQPDPGAPSGRADWPAFLANVLPEVDLFLPSLEETLYMVGSAPASMDGDRLSELGGQLLERGAAVVGVKLGDHGLYLRTQPEPARLGSLPAAERSRWAGRELLAPCFEVKVAGTTGAGDCTVAGFLAGWLRGLPPEAVLTAAVAVGACCVEQPDATSGVPAWDVVQRRLRAGWPRRPVGLPLPGWQWLPEAGVWRSPRDRQA